MGISPDAWQKLLLSVGTHQSSRPLSPAEVSGYLDDLLKAGLSKKQIAERLHLNDASMISKFLMLTKLEPYVRAHVDWGQKSSLISMSSAIEMSRLSGSDQVEVLSKHLEYGISKSEVQQVVQIRLRSGAPIQECIDKVIKLRPVVLVRNVLIGAIEDLAVKATLQKLTQPERDQLLRRVLDGAAKIQGEYTAKLTPEKFTLVGDKSLGGQVRSLKPDFESAINQLLGMELKQ